MDYYEFNNKNFEDKRTEFLYLAKNLEELKEASKSIPKKLGYATFEMILKECETDKDYEVIKDIVSAMLLLIYGKSEITMSKEVADNFSKKEDEFFATLPMTHLCFDGMTKIKMSQEGEFEFNLTDQGRKIGMDLMSQLGKKNDKI